MIGHFLPENGIWLHPIPVPSDRLFTTSMGSMIESSNI